MEFFIIENGQQVGPLTIAQLAEKKIKPETLVWREGMEDWQPAWKVSELRYILEENSYNINGQANRPPVPPSDPANFEQGNLQTHKKSTMKYKIMGGIVLFLLIILIASNPSKETHENTIRTEVSKAIDKATSSNGSDVFSQSFRMMARMVAGNFLDNALHQLFEYHNYLLFSKGTISIDGKEHTVSYGVLGKVITMNADDLEKALDNSTESDKSIDSQTEESENSDNVSESSDDKEDLQNSSDAGSQSDNLNDESSDIQSKLEEKANKAVDKLVDHASKKVEEKINKKIDEVSSDTTAIEKFVDKILDLF